MDEKKDLYDQLGVEPKSEGGAGDILSAGGKSAAISAGISGLGKALEYVPERRVKAVGKFLSAAPVETAIGSAAGGMTGEYLKEKGLPFPIQVGGELLASALPTAGRYLGRKAYESVLGTPSEMAEQLLPKTKELGISVDPKQMRAEGERRVSYAGATPEIAFENQRAVNRAASKATGLEADNITPAFIGQRMDEVGSTIGMIIKGPKGKPKEYGINAGPLEEILRRELDVSNPAYAYTSKLIADNLLDKAYAGTKVSGEVLQRLRSELGKVIRTSTDKTDAWVAGEMIEALDGMIATQLPKAEQLALEKLRPQYRSAVTLDLLAKRGGVDNGYVSAERLGKLLRSKDYKYTQGKSTNPLSDLGQIGETYNLRSVAEKAETPAGSKSDAIAKAVKNIGLISAPIIGYKAGGATGGMEGLALSLGYASAEQLAKALARSKPASMIQTKLGPTMREAPTSYVSPAGKAVYSTEAARPAEE